MDQKVRDSPIHPSQSLRLCLPKTKSSHSPLVYLLRQRNHMPPLRHPHLPHLRLHTTPLLLHKPPGKTFNNKILATRKRSYGRPPTQNWCKLQLGNLKTANKAQVSEEIYPSSGVAGNV